jgi:hypothetical protein
MTTVHSGEVPVSDDTVRGWLRDGVTRVRVEFTASLSDLIGARGMDEWSEFVDEIIGISLTDLAYGFAQPDRADDLSHDVALLFVEGDLDVVSFRYALGEDT